MLECRVHQLTNNLPKLGTGSATATKAAINITGIPSGPLDQGVYILHTTSSAVDEMLVYCDAVSATSYATLGKGDTMFLPVTDLTKIKVATESGTATYSIVAY
jgi:hypothetical protein